MKAKTGHLHDASKYLQEKFNKQTQLNTYIYEYFLHNSMFQCAQSILKADSDVKVQRHSPNSDCNDKGLRLKNAPCNKTIDTSFDSKQPNLLPAPNVPNLSPDSCFLYEWFCLFWAMFNAQKNENQQNWPKWNVSWPQTQSSSLLLQAPGSATHNAFYNPGEMGLTYSIVLDFPKAKVDGLGDNVGVVRMHDWTKASNLRTLQQSNSQTARPPMAAKQTSFQQEGKTDDNWSVQWQNDSSENQIPETSPRGVQGTLQERYSLPPVQPADVNDSVKPRNTISSLSQTSKVALPTPQLSKSAREKGPFPKGTIPKKRTTKVKDEMATCKIPKLNVGSTATRPGNAAPTPVPRINPVGIRKDAKTTSLSQVVPIGQPAVALPLTPASMVANPSVDSAQSATFSMENCNMNVNPVLSL
ncbi:Transcriptional activator somA [Fusarium oxysporum f. sp. rapae]|uniref:Transcriptional activator somA n=1 Tax=Fusarium oxysporum f. sp. rapae TaxID=485398 RepID=A0A8J5TPL2_FUSOX|nr:Transcriptional activator somA [Fusarium oxysporum f. sp. rapae]